jgi:ADP-ribose pyrophosphatase
MPFEIIQSKPVFKGRVFSVRQDEVRRDDGGIMRLDVVEHSDSVTIIPLDEHGNIWFVDQYRHPTGDNLLELPAGVIESGETAEACARREIREEIGMACKHLELIGSFYLAPGYTTEFMYVFLALELCANPLQADEDEFITVEKIPAGAAMKMAEEDKIKDVKTLGALLLARSRLLGQV